MSVVPTAIVFDRRTRPLVEFLPALLEILGGIRGDILLPAVGEGVFERGVGGLVEAATRKRRHTPFLAACGYLLKRAIIATLSLSPFRDSLIHTRANRMRKRLLAAVIGGLAMSTPGAYRRRRGQARMRIDSFFGCRLAREMAIIRDWWARCPGLYRRLGFLCLHVLAPDCHCRHAAPLACPLLAR